MYLAIKDVKPQQGFKLLLTFENGEQRIFDVTPFLNKGIFKELKDIGLFNTVRVSFDSIEWANEADFDPEALYELSEEIDPVSLK